MLSMCVTCMPGAYRVSDEGVGSPATGVTDGFESLCESWDSNPGPGQQMLLTTEPSFQSPEMWKTTGSSEVGCPIPCCCSD